MFNGILSAAFAVIVWGVTFVNTRALLFDFSALEIQVIRFAIAWAVLWGIGLAGRRFARRANPTGTEAVKVTGTEAVKVTGTEAVKVTGAELVKVTDAIETIASTRDEWLFAGMGLTGVFIYQFLENSAIYYTNASNVAILVSFGPLVTALMAKLFRRETQPTTCKLWVGSAIAIAGVALISFNNAVVFELRPLGDLMALAAMISWGVYSMLVDQANEKGYSQVVVIRKTFGWALVFMLPLAFWGISDSGYIALDGSFSVTLDAAANLTRFAIPMNWINLGFLGIFASALCFVLWNVACKSLGVVKTTIGLYLTPIVGVVFAAVFLDERLTAMSAFGGMLIIIGVVMANWRRKDNQESRTTISNVDSKVFENIRIDFGHQDGGMK